MSRTISDIIEEFIMNSLDDDDFIELSRNDLAKFFACVPSQINYVLNTRFTINNGFVVESQRGGGGYIRVLRVKDNDDNFLNNALNICTSPINYTNAMQLLAQMYDRKILNDRELAIVKSSISPKALNNPINIDDIVRANILKQVIIELMKSRKEDN